jgi:hypothetical protein
MINRGARAERASRAGLFQFGLAGHYAVGSKISCGIPVIELE